MGLLAIDVRRKIGFSCDLSECLIHVLVILAYFRHSQILPNIGHALQTILRLRLRYRIIPYIGWTGIKISAYIFAMFSRDLNAWNQKLHSNNQYKTFKYLLEI